MFDSSLGGYVVDPTLGPMCKPEWDNCWFSFTIWKQGSGKSYSIFVSAFWNHWDTGFQPCNLPVHVSANDYDPAVEGYSLFICFSVLNRAFRHLTDIILGWVRKLPDHVSVFLVPGSWTFFRKVGKALQEWGHKQCLENWNLTTAFSIFLALFRLPTWQRGYHFYHCFSFVQ